LTLVDGNAFGTGAPSSLRQDAASSFTNCGTVEITNSFFTTAGAFTRTAGNTKLTNGTLSANGGVDIQGGTLSGTATIHGDVKNAGTVAPGNSLVAAVIDRDGNF
jgi:hypothetical protein